MDPLTQGAIGAALPQSIASKSNIITASILGFLAGMAADLDVFIRSTKDPLLFLEYHRQFTHSLIFIPVGGLVCAIFLHWLVGRRGELTFKQSVFFCTLGYATHALLDACTSYGTMLFWPFSYERISWSTISIVDPFFTLPILSLVILAVIKKKRRYGQVALVWAVIYMSLGMIQRDSAIAMGKSLAENRGHEVIRIEAKPSFANILVWKIIYETSERFYVDAVRTGPSPRIFLGTSLPKLNLARDFSWLDPSGQQAKDIKRFSWFSDGYVARHPDFSDRIIDIRYSMVPNDIAALWSIELSTSASKSDHVNYLANRENIRDRFKTLLNMVLGND
jgi:inner membrane protein